jgi:hypothetical protein
MVAESEAVGRHPVIGEGEGRGEIGRAKFGGAVDARLEGIALAAAQPLPEAPVGAPVNRFTGGSQIRDFVMAITESVYLLGTYRVTRTEAVSLRPLDRPRVARLAVAPAADREG